MKSQYIIIFTIIIVTVASMLLLAKIEDNQRTNNQDFWSIYFINPLENDYHFVIDNKTPNTQLFHYDVIINDNSVHFGDMEIEKNNHELIELEKQESDFPIKIIVTNGNNEKEIEKK